MSQQIIETRLVPFPIQSGIGYPIHISQSGTMYYDKLYGITYQNIDGVVSWVPFATGGNTFTGGTVTGPTTFLSDVTMSGTKGTVTTSGSSTTAFINVSGSNTVGGTGYTDFIRVTNTSAGATNPTKTFRVNNTGAIEFLNNAYSSLIFSLTDAGVLSTPGGGTSDIRLKTNVEYLEDEATSTLKHFKPAKFEFKEFSGITRHGFIAQDMLIVKPELVLGNGNTENGVYGLDYDGILALTVKTLQETLKRVDELEKQIQQLKN